MPRLPRTPAHAWRAPVLLGSAVAIVATMLSVVPAGSSAASVATGRTAVGAAAGLGQVVAWGQNYVGQANVPAGLRGVTAVAAGTYQSLAVRA